MKQQLLLLQDVDVLGKKGELVAAKPGFIRNFLLPFGHALIADKHTLKMRERLQQERTEQAEIDKKASFALAAKLKEVILEHEVKVDPEGHMYGSVTQLDISRLLQEKGHEVDRRQVNLAAPIKKIGEHKIPLRLKEDVEAYVTLRINAEGKPFEAEIQEMKEEAAKQEEEGASA
jgi:large subunit ribosomal protein L9